MNKATVDLILRYNRGLRNYILTKPSLLAAWMDCEHGDWMLSLAHGFGLDRRLFTAYSAVCAETARPMMKDSAVCAALDAAHAYGRGEIDDDELRQMADAAYKVADKYYIAGDYASAYPAYAAAFAADTDIGVSYVYDDDIDAPTMANIRATADICRSMLTEALKPYLEEYQIENG